MNGHLTVLVAVERLGFVSLSEVIVCTHCWIFVEGIGKRLSLAHAFNPDGTRNGRAPVGDA